jgi:hypothetical protein
VGTRRSSRNRHDYSVSRCEGRQLRLGRRRQLVSPGYFHPIPQNALAAAEELHASVAHRLMANELESVGAPDDLVVRCLAAGIDEHDHAQRQLLIAGADPTWWMPPALPLISLPVGRSRAIAQLAAEAFVDGMVGEAAAAQAMRRAANGVEDELAEDLLAMAVDEDRHASLAADIVGWALRESRSTRSAISAARRQLTGTPPVTPSPLAAQAEVVISRLDWMMAWGCALEEADLILSTLRITTLWDDDIPVDPFHLV